MWPISGSNAFQSWQGWPPLERISPKKPGRAAGVQARHHPAFVGCLQLDVPGPHQLGVGDVDEPVAEDVLAEQDLALATLEPSQVDLGLRQDDPCLAQLGDAADRDVHPPAADLGHQAGDERAGRRPAGER